MHSTVAHELNLTRATSWVRWLALAFMAIWFVLLGERALLDPDEARYAEIAREMLVNHDWVTPRLNDLKYFEKPPLQYWITALAFKIFGVNEFASRFWSALAGALGVFAVYSVGARLFGRAAGLACAAVLAGSLMYAVLGHVNTLDMGLCFFLEVALGAFLLAQQSMPGSRRERAWMWVAWAASAGAVLSKGPIGLVLPAVSLLIYSALHRDLTPWWRLHALGGLPIFLVLAAPWYVLVALRNPEFLRFFFVHEHWQRFLTDVANRVEPWWFFAPLLIVGIFPWTTLAPAAIASAWRFERDRSVPPLAHSSTTQRFRARRFLIVWMAVTFVFFSVSHSKLPPYILPMWPAAALLIGEYVTRTEPHIVRRHVAFAACIFALLFGYAVFSPLPLRADSPRSMVAQVVNGVALAAALGAAGTLLARGLCRRGRITAAILCTSAAMLLAVTVLQQDFALTRHLRSARDLAHTIKAHHDARKPFYSIFTYQHSLSFYLGRSVTLVDYQGELEFGQRQEPNKAMPSVQVFMSAWRSDPSETLAVMTPQAYAFLTRQQLPMTVIARDTRLIAVKKP